MAWHGHHPEVVDMMEVMVGARVCNLSETDRINPLTGRAAALSSGSITWAIWLKKIAKAASLA